MGGEAVPKLMRTYRQLDRSIPDMLLEDYPDRSGGKALPEFTDKKWPRVNPGLLPIFLDGLQR